MDNVASDAREDTTLMWHWNRQQQGDSQVGWHAQAIDCPSLPRRMAQRSSRSSAPILYSPRFQTEPTPVGQHAHLRDREDR